VDLDTLRQIDSLAPLPRHQLARVSRRLIWRRYGPGDLILPHQVPIVLEGLVYRGSVQIATVEQGRRQVVGRVPAGKALHKDLSARYLLPVELRAVEPTILCLLPSVSLQVLIAPSAPISRPVSSSVKRSLNINLGVHLTALRVVLASIILLFSLIAWRWQSSWRIPLSNLAYGLASYCLEVNDEAEAISLLQTSLELNPYSVRAYNDLGYIYYRQGRQQEARTAFHQAAMLDPTLAVVQNNLGVSYLGSGQLDLAHKALQQAVALNPESAEAQTNLGVAEHLAGRPEEAIRAYRAALRLNPHDIVAQVNLGVLFYEQNRFSEARGYLEMALQTQSDLPRAKAIVGAIALSEGDQARAWSEFEAILPSLADDPLLHFYLAMWYEEAGMQNNAKQELRKVLELQPRPDLAELAHSHLVALTSRSLSPSTDETETKGD
jgi:Flp pilus assembly protein TadD